MAYGTENEGRVGNSLLFFLAAVLVAVAAWVYWPKGDDKSNNAADSDPNVAKICPTCRGTRRMTCDTCWGRGNVIYVGAGWGTCNDCRGSKTVVCKPCHGNGKIFPSRKPTASILGAHQLVCWDK